MGGKPQVSAQILFLNSVVLEQSYEHSVFSPGNADLTASPVFLTGGCKQHKTNVQDAKPEPKMTMWESERGKGNKEHS